MFVAANVIGDKVADRITPKDTSKAGKMLLNLLVGIGVDQAMDQAARKAGYDPEKELTAKTSAGIDRIRSLVVEGDSDAVGCYISLFKYRERIPTLTSQSVRPGHRALERSANLGLRIRLITLHNERCASVPPRWRRTSSGPIPFGRRCCSCLRSTRARHPLPNPSSTGRRASLPDLEEPADEIPYPGQLHAGRVSGFVATGRCRSRQPGRPGAAEFVMKKFGGKVPRKEPRSWPPGGSKRRGRHGDDVFEAVRKVGPKAITMADDAGENAPRVIRLLTHYGDDAARVLSQPRGMALIGRYGDEAAKC